MNEINLKDKLALFSETWTPKVIAQMNDYQFKLAKFEGEFAWHSHADTDEAFVVIEGQIGIEFRDKTIYLSAGEMCVVPKGVEHKPFAKQVSSVMLIEPKGVVNTGDAASELTAENDVWI